MADTFYKNPIPLALIGLGVGMLVMRGFRGQSYSTSSSRKLPQGRRTNYEFGDVGQPRVQTQQSTGTSAFERMMHQNPLAVGAVAVAAGTAIGLVLPSTRLESEYIGETGERQMVPEGQQPTA